MSIKNIVAPSILASDFANLGAEISDVISKGAEWVHMDVMDGAFVPNISFGAPIVASVRKAFPDAFLDCHLMVADPAKWLPDFAKAGASQVTFHVESFATTEEQQEKIPLLCKAIRENKMRAGIAVKPATNLSTVMPFVQAGLIDMVLIMTVEPGFGGQAFNGYVMSKVKELRDAFPNLDIQVDGGIDARTSRTAMAAGANVFVAGTAVFKAPDRTAVIDAIKAPIAAAAS